MVKGVASFSIIPKRGKLCYRFGRKRLTSADSFKKGVWAPNAKFWSVLIRKHRLHSLWTNSKLLASSKSVFLSSSYRKKVELASRIQRHIMAYGDMYCLKKTNSSSKTAVFIIKLKYYLEVLIFCTEQENQPILFSMPTTIFRSELFLTA